MVSACLATSGTGSQVFIDDINAIDNRSIRMISLLRFSQMLENWSDRASQMDKVKLSADLNPTEHASHKQAATDGGRALLGNNYMWCTRVKGVLFQLLSKY